MLGFPIVWPKDLRRQLTRRKTRAWLRAGSGLGRIRIFLILVVWHTHSPMCPQTGFLWSPTSSLRESDSGYQWPT